MAEYIHHYEKHYKNYVKNINKNKDISNKNKKIIFEFERACFLRQKLELPTRIKYLDVLGQLAKYYVKKDFDKLTKKDFENIIFKLESKKEWTPTTKQKFKAIIKKFGRWIKWKDKAFLERKNEYPETVSWINTNIKRKEMKKVMASDVLTEKEAYKLIENTEHPRDKAFISMLYELGARIGEIGNLKIKDITRDKHSYLVDLNGKTGHRTPRIIMSDPHITAWLNQHPLKNDSEAPVWVTIGNRKTRKLDYPSLSKIIKRIKEKVGIKKRVYAHLFRHTRVTHLLRNKQINESQAKVYFGWVPNSKMLAEYSHLVSNDVNDVLLEMNGIKAKNKNKDLLKPKVCPSCRKINDKNALFCQTCSKPLDFNTAVDFDKKRRGYENTLKSVLKNNKDVRKVLLKALMEEGIGFE
tara:strand:+ start:3357 stop:4589 length:1233 start_codon:yes stop_codon:yes gene_type:complete